MYAQVRHHDFINYDDPKYVIDNIYVRGGLTWEGIRWAFSSAHDSNWIPLTWLSHMLDCQLFGLQSGYHHLTNVVLHIFSTLLLFSILKRTTRAPWRSAFVAGAFAVHPLHVESVAWIAERKDVLSAAFLFLALWLYVSYTERRSYGRYFLVVLAFCGALLSKPMAVAFPLIALLFDVWPLGRHSRSGSSMTSLILEKLPLVVLSLVVSIVTLSVQQSAGTVSSFGQLPFRIRFENAVISYVTYLLQFIWPNHLAVFYPYSLPLRLWKAVIAGLVLILTTVLVLGVRRRQPSLTVGWLWYLGTLVPVIGIVQAGAQARADRYTYVPMVGISIMLAWGLTAALQHWRWGRTTLGFLAVIVCSAWLVTTDRNLEFWQDSISLFRHAISVTGNNYVAYQNLGVALKQTGQLTEAVSDFQMAVSLWPQDPVAQDSLGEALTSMGRPDDAIPHLDEAVHLQPNSAKAHIDLAEALMKAGRVDDAAAQYRLALQLDPGSADAHYGLGGILMAQNRPREALPHLEQALPQLVEASRAAPEDADLHYNLGTLFGVLGRADEAIRQFSDAVGLRPDDAEAHFNLATGLAAKGRSEEAINELRAAVRLRPDYIRARLSLGSLSSSSGHCDEAIREFSAILNSNPGLAEARRGLQVCGVLSGK